MTGTGTDDAVGTLLGGRFRIESLLGRGGMATVYLATDESLGRTVAVKVFRRDLADGDDIRRQQDEIQLLASLNHPGLVTLFDAAVDDDRGSAFLVMELVTGNDLRTRLTAGAIPSSEVATIGQHLADALAYLHARGVVHRDIKPANILLPERDADHTGPRAKLTDFGIARIVDGTRLTATGTVLGTAGYFSPEQALGEPIAPASDIYSLGLVLLECLTGERAFPGPALESMTARVTRDPEVPEELGPDWVSLLRAMTSRTPDARPAAREVSTTLAQLPERLDPTRRYPVAGPDALESATALPTEVMVPQRARAAPGAASWPWPWRRIAMIAGSVAVLLLLGWLVALAVSAIPAGTQSPAAPSYPAVGGQLGTHLDQLQRSVQP